MLPLENTGITGCPPSGFNPKAAELLEEAEAGALAYLDFPYEHHRRLRANNVQERLNREVKRRGNVVQVFPSRKSLIRMLGAVLSEKDEGWAARRWFTEKSTAEAYEEPGRRKPAPKPTYEGTATEHAARKSAKRRVTSLFILFPLFETI